MSSLLRFFQHTNARGTGHSVPQTQFGTNNLSHGDNPGVHFTSRRAGINKLVHKSRIGARRTISFQLSRIRFIALKIGNETVQSDLEPTSVKIRLQGLGIGELRETSLTQESRPKFNCGFAIRQPQRELGSFEKPLNPIGLLQIIATAMNSTALLEDIHVISLTPASRRMSGNL
jgi:hypothetical protein